MTDAKTKQRDTALARANKKRKAQAVLHRRIAAGTVDIRDVILDPPECLKPGKAGRASAFRTALEVIGWQRRWGPARAAKLLRKLEWSSMAMNGPVYNLPLNRRKEIVELLDEKLGTRKET